MGEAMETPTTRAKKVQSRPQYVLRNIYRQKRGQTVYIYAHLYDLSQPEGRQLTIASTLEFILDTAKERGYEIEGVNHVKDNPNNEGER